MTLTFETAGQTQNPSHLVVLIHGYGADGNDLIGLAPQLQSALPTALFVSPHAPNPCEMLPFGRQWFSLVGWNPMDLQACLDVCALGVAEARASLTAFIEAQLKAHGLTADKLALLGFSQGAMLALETAITLPEPPTAVLAYSGALIGRLTPEVVECLKGKTAIHVLHGEMDAVVPHAAFTFTREKFESAGLEAQFHSLPALGHSIDGRGLKVGHETLANLA